MCKPDLVKVLDYNTQTSIITQCSSNWYTAKKPEAKITD